MTMPITLWAMARVFRGAKGFAFGLLCFGLFIGTLPAFLMYPSRLENVPNAVFTVAAAVSLAVLAAFLIKRVTGKEQQESRRESLRID
jgi:carbon starvation protein CstA